MNKSLWNNVYGFLLLVVVLAVLAIGILKGYTAFNNLNGQLQASTLQVVGIIGVAIITFVANKSIEKKRIIETALQKEKVKLYDEYIKFFFRVFSGEKIGDKPSEEEITKFFVERNPLITTYASNGVIKKVGEMRLKLENNPEAMFVVEDVLMEIRKDLGHSGRNFGRGDILRLFINDIDDYMKKTKVSKTQTGKDNLL